MNQLYAANPTSAIPARNPCRRWRWAGLLAWPLCAAAASASQWCTVPVDTSAPELGSAIKHLQSEADRPPAPLAHLHTEGTLPHQGIHDQSVEARRDLPRMQLAALAWRENADPQWLAVAQQYLLAWVGTYQPSLNPIDETGFDALIDTYAIIAPAMPEPDRARAGAYLRAWAAAYIRAMQAPGRQGTWTNNWQSHRVKLVTMVAVALDDPDLFKAARALFQRQLNANLAADGEPIDFAQRDALHYVVYDLQPLLQAALAARNRGEDWYHWRSANGASLAASIAWLQPYADGHRSHREFVHSHVRFDAIRADAGIAGYRGDFDPHSAGTVYWLAAEFDPALQPLAAQLQAKAPAYIAMCGQ